MGIINERVGRFGFIERIGGALIDPEITFNTIIKRGIGVRGAILNIILFSVVEALLFSSAISLILMRVAVFLREWFGFSLASAGWLPWVITPTFIGLKIVLSLLAWVILGGLAHLSARHAFSGEGTYSEILTLYGYGWSAKMPLLAGAALSILTQNPVYLLVFALVSFIWILIVWTAAVKVSHGIDFGRAFISVFIVPLVVFTLIGLGCFLALASFGGWLG
jgi:hypothetical protein